MSYVIAGYAITFVVLAGYTVRLLRRARALRAALPPEPATPPGGPGAERTWR
jgi:CcmD family protein